MIKDDAPVSGPYAPETGKETESGPGSGSDPGPDPGSGSDVDPGSGAEIEPGAKKRLAKHIVYYTFARLAMFVALAAVIEGVGTAAVDEFPLLLAAALALVVSLPLSMVLFKSLRLQVNRDISAVDATRRAHREALEAELRGEADRG